MPRSVPLALHLHAGSAVEVGSVNSKGSVHSIELKQTLLDVEPRCNCPCAGTQLLAIQNTVIPVQFGKTLLWVRRVMVLKFRLLSRMYQGPEKKLIIVTRSAWRSALMTCFGTVFLSTRCSGRSADGGSFERNRVTASPKRPSRWMTHVDEWP